jgi:hypothetical protein
MMRLRALRHQPERQDDQDNEDRAVAMLLKDGLEQMHVLIA